MIKKYEHIRAELDNLRESGTAKGNLIGFKCLDELITLKEGTFMFILAPPHHGKSELCFEIAFTQADKGRKTLIYSPETGSVEDIYAELIHKYIGKPFYANIPGSVNEKEYYKAIGYIDEYFSVVDSDSKSYSFTEICDLATDCQFIISDPYNEIKHDMGNYGGRQDLYIEDWCSELRRYCKKNKKYWIQTLHPAHQQIITNGSLRYYPMPTAREAAGGQALLRKAFAWVNMWRPPVGLNDEFGVPYADNIVLIAIEKAKPKGIGKKGATHLFFDWHKNRYYEMIDGKKCFAYEHEKESFDAIPFTILPSKMFNEVEKEAEF